MRPSGSADKESLLRGSSDDLEGGLDADLGVELSSSELLFAGVSASWDCFSGVESDSARGDVSLLLSLVLLLLLLLLLDPMEDPVIFVAGGVLLLGLVKGGDSFLGEGEGLPLAAPGLVVPAS